MGGPYIFFSANVSCLGGDLMGKWVPGAWEKLCLPELP